MEEECKKHFKIDGWLHGPIPTHLCEVHTTHQHLLPIHWPAGRQTEVQAWEQNIRQIKSFFLSVFSVSISLCQQKTTSCHPSGPHFPFP